MEEAAQGSLTYTPLELAPYWKCFHPILGSLFRIQNKPNFLHRKLWGVVYRKTHLLSSRLTTDTLDAEAYFLRLDEGT